MASVQIKSTTQQTSCVQIGGPASFQDVGPYWRTEANANKGCMWMRTRTKTFAPVTCKPPSSRKNHEKSPQQHNNQSYARCGVLSARSQDVCLMSSHVDVYRGWFPSNQKHHHMENYDVNTACNWSAMVAHQQRRCPSMPEREIETCCRPCGLRTSSKLSSR